ncbi:hypothetical protein GCM10027275_08410 [Rhabdobacter roseus]|uniref:Uncharacterized protein n=1 Tax=Rhabdobacter roseus TaxID=1655419 RepID=A0A840THJ7_9BACT|nr:hypothetical protein [Rhabdobacter roseus]MBB5282741.1 hypothetical protein [Rhabdobacter roseus]
MKPQEEQPEEHIEGGTPSPSGRTDAQKHTDDADKSSEVLDQEAIDKSEENNMTKHKGYNETPDGVPVKTKKKEGTDTRSF